MRQPHQILAFPYKKDVKGNYLYGIFCRKGKTEKWQGIAGGVEEGETFLEACKREANEEAGISYDAKVRLKWDSNRNALWELNWKLLNNKMDI